MCSYNRLNGQYACENHHLLTRILRRDWGFKGYVLADYGAAKSAINALNNGLDFDPWPGLAYQPALVNRRAGLVPGEHGGPRRRGPPGPAHALRARVLRPRHVRRRRRPDRPGRAPRDRPRDRGVGDHPAEERRCRRRRCRCRAKARRRIAVVGKARPPSRPGADRARRSPSASWPRWTPSASGPPPRRRGRLRRRQRRRSAAEVARGADAALVFVGDYQTEFTDRDCLSLECPNFAGDQDGLVAAVAKAAATDRRPARTGGPVLTPWRNEVPAVLDAWYPVLLAGPAIARSCSGTSTRRTTARHLPQGRVAVPLRRRP